MLLIFQAKILQVSINFTDLFPEKNLKAHQWLFLSSDFFLCLHILKKYEAADIIPSLTRLKRNGS